MRLTPSRLFPVLVASVLLAPATVRAATFDPEALAQAIAPHIDSQTIAVVHLDVSRVEPAALSQFLTDLVPDAKDDIAREATPFLAFARQTANTWGCDDAFVVMGINDWPNPAVVVARKRAGTGAHVVAPALVYSLKEGGWGVEETPTEVVLAHHPVLDKTKQRPAEPRPELAAAFRAAGESAMQVLLLPNDDTRRVVEQLYPKLPAPLGTPMTVITQGARWGAIAIDAPPKLALRFTLQSQNKAAAQALGDMLRQAAKLAESPETLAALQSDVHAAELLKLATQCVPEVTGDQLTLRLDAGGERLEKLLAALRTAIGEARNVAKGTQSASNLKQIAIAMHNFHDAHKRFPAVGSTDPSGEMLLSWRVHLLPYLEQRALYDQFHLNEPWDSPHNRTLIEKMPAIFASLGSKAGAGKSTYQVVVGEHTAFPGREGTTFKQFTDGTVKTILAVEVDDAHATTWTKPEGLPFDDKHPEKGLGSPTGAEFHAAFADGSVRRFKLPLDPETLRRMILRDDGNPVDLP